MGISASMATRDKMSPLAIVSDVASGERSAISVAEATIARIARDNPALNAIVTFDSDDLLRQAEVVDRRVVAGEVLPLAGVPVTVKDNIWVKGQRVAQGSRLFADFVAPQDAIAVARLRAAGALIAGMANTSEFACKGVTTNLLFGATRHPQDHALTPGGSSGGPAVAVAAGLVPIALGTDAGGSSRRPPAHVGVVGFKPSFGAVAYGPGFAEPFVGLSSLCPIARIVTDAALMFAAIAGPDPRDPTSIPLSQSRWTPDRPLTIAYSPRLGLDVPIDADVEAAVETAIAGIEAAGLRVIRRDPQWPDGMGEAALMPLQHAGLAALYGERWRTQPNLFDPDIGRKIESGLALSGALVGGAQLFGQAVARQLAAFFDPVDILVCPTTPCTSWPLDRLGPERIGGVAVEPRAHAVFTPFFNHAQVPAISIPCGHGRAGLPVGLQIVAAGGADWRLLDIARFIEALLDDAHNGAENPTRDGY